MQDTSYIFFRKIKEYWFIKQKVYGDKLNGFVLTAVAGCIVNYSIEMFRFLFFFFLIYIFQKCFLFLHMSTKVKKDAKEFSRKVFLWDSVKKDGCNWNHFQYDDSAS